MVKKTRFVEGEVAWMPLFDWLKKGNCAYKITCHLIEQYYLRTGVPFGNLTTHWYFEYVHLYKPVKGEATVK